MAVGIALVVATLPWWWGAVVCGGAARVELPHVLAWAWSGARAGEIVAEGWRIEKGDTVERSEAAGDAGWSGLWEQMAKERAWAEQWLPPVRATDGAGFGVTVDEMLGHSMQLVLEREGSLEAAAERLGVDPRTVRARLPVERRRAQKNPRR